MSQIKQAYLLMFILGMTVGINFTIFCLLFFGKG